MHRRRPLSAKSRHRSLYSITSSAATKDRRRHGQSQRLGGFDINQQFELGCLHDWQIGRLLAFQDTANIKTSLTVRFSEARSVAN